MTITSTSITTTTGATKNLDDLLETLRSAVRGPVLTEGDDGYDEARRLNNALIDKRPAVIVRCAGCADVCHAIRFAREHELLVAVRGGGHGVAGNAVCDGGLMLDLSLMKSVHVDPAAGVASVQGGATLADLDWETQLFGLAAPVGVVSMTGVAGLTLGGGYGWLRGKHGMSVDNLVAVEIVTADGELRIASEAENADLFWAVRGGGGNFGVATSFTFRVHPIGPIVFQCAPMYDAENARDILLGWREFMVEAPDEVTTEFFFWTIPSHESFPPELHGENVVTPAAVYAGSADEGERVLQPLRELGPRPLLDLSGQRPFVEVQQTFDPYLPTGESLNYWKALYLDGWSTDLVDALVEISSQRPAGSTIAPLVLHDLRGASSRVPVDATAFSNRTQAYLIELNSSWTDPADSEQNVAWTRDAWETLRRRFSSGGVYLNMDSYNEDGEPLVHTTYGANYERLQTVKKKYDPDNFFRLNMNIQPASRA